MWICVYCYQYRYIYFSSRRRHTICALVTGVQTCALPILGGSHHRDASEDEIEIFRRALALPDARNESAVLLQIVGRLLGIEDHRRIEEAEEDDAERIERHVERRAMLKRGGHRDNREIRKAACRERV